jgi:hypothetical protein
MSILYRSFELIGSVCNNKKGVVIRHRSAHTQDNIVHIHETLLFSLTRFVTVFPVAWYQKNINTHHHSTSFNKSIYFQSDSGVVGPGHHVHWT